MVLLFFMDGLKYEMVNDNMPFMSSLNKIPLKSEFGYSCACHATMYTSKYINEHNTWFVWKRGDNSPYKFINKVPLLKYLNFIPVKMVLAKIARKLHKNTSFPGIPMLVNLPLKYWSLFEPCENVFWTDDNYLPKYDTLFKILKKENISNNIVALSKNGNVFDESKDLTYKDKKFSYFFIGDVDSYLHKYGEKAKETIEYLNKVDTLISKVYNQAKEFDKDITVICYSDHGHIDVEKKIDINQYFKPHNMNVNNYIHLVESTFVRFWFRNAKEKNEVEKVIKEMQQKQLGFIIDETYKQKYHLNFSSNEHGDLIFHLNAPNIFTNTIWGFGKTIKSMHGYYPELPKHFGVFASNKEIAEVEYAQLIDILPSTLEMLDIDCSKYDFDGKNIIRK